MNFESIKTVEFTDRSTALEAHLRHHDSAVIESHCFQWTAGPVARAMPDLCVIKAHAVDSADYWHYLTSGASSMGPGGACGTEFWLKTSVESALHIELASMVAYMHRDPAHRLDVGHTMNIGRPLLVGSPLDRLLVSLPYPLGPDFEYLHLSNNCHARVLWLLPITMEEEALCHHRGLAVLEQRFEAEGIDVLDPFRNSVA